MNALVTELLERGLQEEGSRDALRVKMKALGLLAEVPPPRGPVLSRDEAVALTRGRGTVVGVALEAGRKNRL